MRIRVAAVTDKLVKQHTNSEQVGGDVPAGKVAVRWLVWRSARLRTDGVSDPGGYVEVEQLRSGARENHVVRFDVAVDEPAVLQFLPLVRLGFGQVAFATLSIQVRQAR